MNGWVGGRMTSEWLKDWVGVWVDGRMMSEWMNGRLGRWMVGWVGRWKDEE